MKEPINHEYDCKNLKSGFHIVAEEKTKAINKE